MWDDGASTSVDRAQSLQGDWRPDREVELLERRSVHAWATFSLMSLVVMAVAGFAIFTADDGSTSIGEVPADASVALESGGAGELALSATSTSELVDPAGGTAVDELIDGLEAQTAQAASGFEWAENDSIPAVALTPDLFEDDLVPVGPPVPANRQVPISEDLTANPIGLRIADLDVVAQVDAVGIEEDGSMEIPDDILEVGWYDLGPRPGEAGSAVLAGHVDGFPQRAGAFFSLREMEIGSRVLVDFDDGSTREFVAVGVKLYDKHELPIEELFRNTGPTSLALITCGGAFDQERRSYEHNLVVIAEPVSPETPPVIPS